MPNQLTSHFLLTTELQCFSTNFEFVPTMKEKRKKNIYITHERQDKEET